MTDRRSVFGSLVIVALLALAFQSCAGLKQGSFGSLSHSSQVEYAKKIADGQTLPEIDPGNETEAGLNELRQLVREVRASLAANVGEPEVEVTRLEHPVLRKSCPTTTFFRVLYFAKKSKGIHAGFNRYGAALAIDDDSTPHFLESIEDIVAFLSRHGSNLKDAWTHEGYALDFMHALAVLRGLKRGEDLMVELHKGKRSEEPEFGGDITQWSTVLHKKGSSYVVVSTLLEEPPPPGWLLWRVGVSVDEHGKGKLLGVRRIPEGMGGPYF